MMIHASVLSERTKHEQRTLACSFFFVGGWGGGGIPWILTDLRTALAVLAGADFHLGAVLAVLALAKTRLVVRSETSYCTR